MTAAQQRGFRWYYIPLGCGGLLALMAAASLTIFMFVMSLLRQSEPYAEAMRRAEADPQVLEVLGSPIEAGRFVTGQIQTNPAGGNADLSIPVSGPNGEGRLFVNAVKVAGQWQYNVVELEVEGGARIVVDGM